MRPAKMALLCSVNSILLTNLDKYHSWVNGAYLLKGKEVGVFDFNSRAKAGKPSRNFLTV
jgi:hypothetical protein